jgi:Lamin Tail Domain
MRTLAYCTVLFLFGFSTLCSADWAASGVFQYTDRTYSSSGWTGSAALPIRMADVQVYDENDNVLASTYTDINGEFSVLVSDSSVRHVSVRVLTDSLSVPDLNVEVSDDTVTLRPVYAMSSGPENSHNPGTDVNFGTITAPLATGNPASINIVSQAFNSYDMGVMAAQWVEAREGAFPTTKLRIGWNPNRSSARTGSSYSGNGRLNLSDDDGYDDPNILHEIGHYIDREYSRGNSPGGSHSIGDNYQDPRLSWGEGLATWFSAAIIQQFNGYRPDIYSDRNSFGTSGGFAYQFESPSSSYRGPANEALITAVLYDIIDSTTSDDQTVATDDDNLTLPDIEVWEVLRSYRTVRPPAITVEDFLVRWFDPMIGNASETEIKEIFGPRDLSYWDDAYEPDDSLGQATAISLGISQFHTFFFDNDVDWLYFDNATPNSQYFVETSGNNYGLNNPVVEVFAADGLTRLGINTYENVSYSSKQNAELLFVTPAVGRYYIRVSRIGAPQVPDTLYGEYTLVLTTRNVTPSITAIEPDTIPRGVRTTLAIRGSNFLYHSVPSLSGDGVDFLSWEVLNPETIVAEVDVAANATVSSRDLTVTSLDGRSDTRSGYVSIVSSGGVLRLSEIKFADNDSSPAAIVEIYNTGPGSQSLAGWELITSQRSTSSRTFDQFAGVTLAAGSYMQVFDVAGTNTATAIYDNANSIEFPLQRREDGMVELRNGSGDLIDYVRYYRNVRFPRYIRTAPSDSGWGQLDALVTTSYSSTTLARSNALQDSNQGRDWVHQSNSMGSPNVAPAFTNTPTPYGYPAFGAAPTATPTPTNTATPTSTPTASPLPLTLDGVLDADAILVSSVSRYSLYAKMDGDSIYVAVYDASAAMKPKLANAVFTNTEAIYLVLARQGVETRFSGIEDPNTNPNYIFLDGGSIISVDPQDSGTGGGYIRYNSLNTLLTQSFGLSDVLIGASANVLEMLVPKAVNNLNTSSFYAWAVVGEIGAGVTMTGSAPPPVSDDSRINLLGELSLIDASAGVKGWREK